MTIQEILKDKYYQRMPYKELAEKYDTSYVYVRQIAVGMRKCVRGKGLAIKRDLEKMVEEVGANDYSPEQVKS